jgi:hypothetical protein
VGEVDYALRTQLAWTAGAEAHVRIVAGDGGTVMEQVLPVAAADGAFSVRVPARGGLPEGEYAVQVQLRSLAGTATPLVDTLRLVVSGRTTALGEPVFWRRGPSTATRYIMTATPRFQRNERLRVEFASAVDGQASARLLDRLGNPLQVPVQAGVRDGADGVRWVVADVVLAPLAPGEYAIEITLAGATGRADFRVVP